MLTREIVGPMSEPKPGSKYYPLYEYLRARPDRRVRLSFGAAEAILEEALPSSAYRDRGFWSNRERGGLQAAAWLEAGFRVVEISLARGEVIFERVALEHATRGREESGRWNAYMVRALRHQLGLSQQSLADLMGIRQQTVSEWERGVYKPTRGRSKHLGMIAEQAGLYRTEQTDVEGNSN
jgi:DNA-binding transcriptional regulator YiaG